MKKSFLTAGILWAATLFSLSAYCADPCNPKACCNATKQIYEWRIYTLTGDSASLNHYFLECLIPACSRLNVKTGAFQPTEYAEGEPQRRYLLLVYSSIEHYLRVKHEIWNDTLFRAAAQPFFDRSAATPVYSNFEDYLCEAFDAMPQMRSPESNRGIFEFRLYRSPNEEANQRKISMFNNTEISIFDETGINSVCYGEVLAGAKMPSLIYLTRYENLEKRNAAWDNFKVNPRWIALRKDPKYAHTATETTRQLLAPLLWLPFF